MHVRIRHRIIGLDKTALLITLDINTLTVLSSRTDFNQLHRETRSTRFTPDDEDVNQHTYY